DVRDLMAASDAYVSLHRSEGTGLTITDAMALGKPVIATGWSGNLDFMNVSNSLPVRYELVEIEETVGPYEAGEVWANPSVEHAAELMRLVFERPDLATALGRAAKRDIETGFGETSIGTLVQQRLAVIGSQSQFASFQQETRGFYRRYKQLVREIREITRAVVAQAATVLVVSKGDEEMVELDGRCGWHFPQTDDGTYVGYHPADSATVIAHLEDLRAKGAGFLLFPGTSFWWLDHYAELRTHLEARYRCAWRDERCLVYDLAGSNGGQAAPTPVASLGARP
ncbi:MAG: glycosyltransferase, partial [Chloroflexi bacterium]|nr:glycosyltransferase [Chloroflexota bacterium]